MNATTKFAIGTVTEAGEIMLPLDIRNSTGLVPGRAYKVAVDDLGRAVIAPVSKFSPEEQAMRRKQVEQGLRALAGKYSLGMSTDAYMREIRGNEEP